MGQNSTAKHETADCKGKVWLQPTCPHCKVNDGEAKQDEPAGAKHSVRKCIQWHCNAVEKEAWQESAQWVVAHITELHHEVLLTQ